MAKKQRAAGSTPAQTDATQSTQASDQTPGANPPKKRAPAGDALIKLEKMKIRHGTARILGVALIILAGVAILLHQLVKIASSQSTAVAVLSLSINLVSIFLLPFMMGRRIDRACQDAMKRIAKHQVELERRLDPGRTSSGVHPTGRDPTIEELAGGEGQAHDH